MPPSIPAVKRSRYRVNYRRQISDSLGLWADMPRCIEWTGGRDIRFPLYSVNACGHRRYL